MNAQLALMLLCPKRPRASKRRTFFDTTGLPAADLYAAIHRAEVQEEKVLAVYRARGYGTPSEILACLTAAGVPILITSVRRSIATLTKAGALVKTDEKKPGPWNAPETVWELVGPEVRAA